MDEDVDRYYELGMVRSDEILALHHTIGWVTTRIVNGGFPTEMIHDWPACATTVAVGPQAGSAIPDYIIETVNGAQVKLLKNDDERENLIDEYLFGFSEPQAHIWREFPEGRTGRRAMRSDMGSPQLTATSESAFGKLMRGVESPIHAPTTKGRVFLPHSEDQEPKWAVYNPSGLSFTLKQRIIRNPLIFESLRPQEKEDANIINLVLRNMIKTGVTKWAPGWEGWEINNFRKTYGVDPVGWHKFPQEGLLLGYVAIDGCWKPLGEG